MSLNTNVYEQAYTRSLNVVCGLVKLPQESRLKQNLTCATLRSEKALYERRLVFVRNGDYTHIMFSKEISERKKIKPGQTLNRTDPDVCVAVGCDNEIHVFNIYFLTWLTWSLVLSSKSLVLSWKSLAALLLWSLAQSSWKLFAAMFFRVLQTLQELNIANNIDFLNLTSVGKRYQHARQYRLIRLFEISHN